MKHQRCSPSSSLVASAALILLAIMSLIACFFGEAQNEARSQEDEDIVTMVNKTLESIQLFFNPPTEEDCINYMRWEYGEEPDERK